MAYKFIVTIMACAAYVCAAHAVDLKLSVQHLKGTNNYVETPPHVH